VLAANPCPCGEYHPFRRENDCTCGEVRRREYRRKLSGPIADRIDISRFVEPVKPHELRDPLARPESSAEVLARVTAARDRQRARYAESPWRLNAHVPGPVLREAWPLEEAAGRRLDQEVYSGALTRRGATRAHRVSWSVADLRGLDRPGCDELEVALRLRRATPLDLDMIGGAA
jgi:magnesium chelatase family protein